ncbi:transposase family protein [Streptomyces canus]|uniref:transposase family protein n=1 Tax=Streptomyces canus TaxID=58343 RepID=UPI0038B6B022
MNAFGPQVRAAGTGWSSQTGSWSPSYAQAEGVRLRLDGTEIQVRRPAAHRPGRRRFVSGKRRQNTHECTVASDSEGRPLWVGAHRPGRMHDQTALKTEGIEDLLGQLPPSRTALGGYLGLAF